ncbi:MAG: serine/threonine protein kinase [Gemmatimonadetes bacterium]|nr:serine/threonine protein kinase [Gemmatimonadota bacterium]
MSASRAGGGGLRSRIRGLLPYVIALVGGFFTAYLLVAFVVFPAGVIPRDVKVPNVTGLAYEDADRRLIAAGFKAEKGEVRFHASAPQGTVLDQVPPADAKELMGTSVTLAVSGGQKMGTVPNIGGMTQADAERAIEEAGFNVGETSDQPSTQPRGTVVDARPRAGSSLPMPGVISIVLSAGPTTMSMPDVVGRPLADARSFLQQVGIAVADVVNDDGGPPRPNQPVISQSPAGGAQVPMRSRVSLHVAGGPP